MAIRELKEKANLQRKFCLDLVCWVIDHIVVARPISMHSERAEEVKLRGFLEGFLTVEVLHFKLPGGHARCRL